MENQENTREEILCKICHSPCNEEFPYAHPCKCRGSLKYIHIECLNEWVSLSKSKKCGICNYSFRFEKKFRAGSPKSVPPHYVLMFILKWALDVLIDISCLVYAVGKFSFAIFLNSSMGSRYFIESKSPFLVFFGGLCITLISLFHSHFCKKVFSVIGTLRERMDTRRALQDVLGEDLGDPESRLPREVRQVSRSSESDSQIYENLNEDIEINLPKILFSRPTLQNLKSDLLLILSMSCISITYPFVHCCSGVLRLLLQKVPLCRACQYLASLDPSAHSSLVKTAIEIPRKALEAFLFMERVSLARFYLESTVLMCLLFIAALALYLLKTRTSCHGFKIAFGVVKSYSLLIWTTLHIIVSVGFVSHILFSNAFNRGDPVFPASDFKMSFIMHFCFGIALTYLSRSVKNKLMKRFRRGLITKALRDEKVKTLIIFCDETSFGTFLKRSFQNFLIYCFLPASTCIINRADLGFSLRYHGNPGAYICFKSLMILYRNSSSIVNFFAHSFESITRFYSRLFGADNYIYNKEVAGLDRSRLVWALNSRYADQKYFDWLENINRTLRRNVAKDCTKKRVSSATDSHSSTNDSSIGDAANTLSDTGLSRSLEMGRNSILGKYQITEKRISKYLGKIHNRKISLFYRPKHFGIFKSLTYISCFLFVQLVFRATLGISLFACSNFHEEESKSICFMFCCCLSFSFICKLYELKRATFRSLVVSAVNRGVLLAYSNILFPFIGSIGLVLLYASRSVFAQFTSIFAIINSLSSITSIIFENVFLTSQIQNYSAMYVVRQLCSFLCLKLTIFSSFMIYKKMIRFNSFCIPALLMFTATFQAIRLARLMFSGDLMARIRDYFFLERTNVIDYNHCNDE